MKNIFLFSGLGADERAFQFLDLPGYNLIFIAWIKPNDQETIESYANRLIAQITSEKPILIGLSFGGLIAIEVGKIIDTDQIILISSAKNQREIPFYYRLIGLLHISSILPANLLTRPNKLVYWFFGAANLADKKLLAEILRTTDPVFLKWAIKKLVSWKSNTQHEHLTHLHGTADRMFPFYFIKNARPIIGGGHFMVVNKPDEISEMIIGLL